MATEAITISANSGAGRNHSCGTMTSDGTIAYISCGFQPTYIKLINETQKSSMEWWAGMTAADYFKVIYHADGAVVSYETSGGPIVFAGDDDESEGFVIPAALLTDADVVHWFALP